MSKPGLSNSVPYRCDRLCLTFALCMVAFTRPAFATEAMSNSSSRGTTVTVTATQALDGMLELVRNTPAVNSLTPHEMSERLGFPVTSVRPEAFGYAQPLPGGWAFSVEWQRVGAVGPRVDLIFAPATEQGEPSPDVICTPDFDKFTGALDRMGFKRQRMHAEHGRWTYDAFDRAGQHIEVYPLAKADTTDGKITHACVGKVLLR